MDWLIPAIVGWCGTGWPWRWPFVPSGTGGGGFDPDNPWPPNCPVCGLITRLGGAAVSIFAANALAGNELTSGLLGTVVVSLAAGKVGGDIVNTVGRMVSKQ